MASEFALHAHLAPRGKENSLRLEQVHKTYSVQSSFPSLEHLPFVSTSVAVIPAKGENWVSTSKMQTHLMKQKVRYLEDT